ncbi:hypothetical protein C8Q76DRAFT_782247 [Earliella scabrosa]|nr:hypothetical protein C8Q76DRAFT_782247 [Earliella scabrosa]
MSTGNYLVDPSTLIALHQRLNILVYRQFSGAVLLVFDYLITIDQEISLYWTHRLNGAAVLFFLNRYFLMIFNVCTTFATFLVNERWGSLLCNTRIFPQAISPVSCPVFSKITWGLSFLPYLVWAAFSSLRAFALSRSWPAAIIVFILSAMIIVMNMSCYHFGLSGADIPRIGCTPISKCAGSTAMANRLIIVPRVCLIVADSILVYITWSTVHDRLQVLQEDVRYSFSKVLLRDGTAYFIVLSALNGLQLTLALLSITIPNSNASYVSIFTAPLTCILVNRFLLNLQAAERSTYKRTSTISLDAVARGSAPSESESVLFQRIVGSIGSAIEPDVYFSDSLNNDSEEEIGEEKDDMALPPHPLDSEAEPCQEGIPSDLAVSRAMTRPQVYKSVEIPSVWDTTQCTPIPETSQCVTDPQVRGASPPPSTHGRPGSPPISTSTAPGYLSGQCELREMKDEAWPEGEELRICEKDGIVLLNHSACGSQDPTHICPETDDSDLRNKVLDMVTAESVMREHVLASVRSLVNGQHELAFTNGQNGRTALSGLSTDGAYSRVRHRLLVSPATPIYDGFTSPDIFITPEVAAR